MKKATFSPSSTSECDGLVGPKSLLKVDGDSNSPLEDSGKKEATSLNVFVYVKKSNSALSTRAPNEVESILPRSGRIYYLLHWISSFKQAIQTTLPFGRLILVCETARVQNATEHFVP